MNYPDTRLDDDKDAANDISRVVSRRDMATQMSPEGSQHSSPRCRLSFSPSTPYTLPMVELESVQSSKLEVRDVQVDERVTMTRWSKKHKARFSGKGSESVGVWKKKDFDALSCAWGVSDPAKSISQYAYSFLIKILLFLFLNQFKCKLCRTVYLEIHLVVLI